MKTVFAAFFSLTVVGGPFNAHSAPQYLGTHCPELSKLELHLKSSKLTVPAIEKNDPYKTQNLDRPPFSHCHAPIWYELMIQKDGTKHFNDLSSQEQIEAIRAEEGRFQNISSEYRKLLQIVYSIEYAWRKFKTGVTRGPLDNQEPKKMNKAEVIGVIHQLLKETREAEGTPQDEYLGGTLFEEYFKQAKNMSEKDPLKLKIQHEITTTTPYPGLFDAYGRSLYATSEPGMPLLWKPEEMAFHNLNRDLGNRFANLNQRTALLMRLANQKLRDSAKEMGLGQGFTVEQYIEKIRAMSDREVQDNITNPDVNAASEKMEALAAELTKSIKAGVTDKLLHQIFDGVAGKDGSEFTPDDKGFAKWRGSQGGKKAEAQVLAKLNDQIGKVYSESGNLLYKDADGKTIGPDGSLEVKDPSKLDDKTKTAWVDKVVENILKGEKSKAKLEAVLQAGREALAAENLEKMHPSAAAGPAGLPFEPYTQEELREKGIAAKAEAAAEKRAALTAARQKCVDPYKLDTSKSQEYEKCLADVASGDAAVSTRLAAHLAQIEADSTVLFKKSLLPKAKAVRKEHEENLAELKTDLQNHEKLKDYTFELSPVQLAEFYETNWVDRAGNAPAKFDANARAFRTYFQGDGKRSILNPMRYIVDPFEEYVLSQMADWVRSFETTKKKPDPEPAESEGGQ